MKKLLIIAAASFVASSALAQGLLNWSTSAATGSTVRYGSDTNFGAAKGTVYDGSFVGSSPLTMGLFVGAAGAGEGSLQLVATSVKTVGTAGPGKGNVSAASFAVPGFNFGSTISLQIRAWSGLSYGEGAVAGKSGLTQITLGGPAPTPATVAWSSVGVAPTLGWNGIAPTGSGPLQGLTLSIVPEPASASLLGLGLASLLIFRRRK